MASYGIREVEALLDLKAHVIRYWEREIPLIQPQKDAAGRRLYSKGDLRLLLRLKYLLYERHFTLEGAREEILREIAGHAPDLRAHIDALRSDLVDLFFGLKARRHPDGVLDQAGPLSPASRQER